MDMDDDDDDDDDDDINNNYYYNAHISRNKSKRQVNHIVESIITN